MRGRSILLGLVATALAGVSAGAAGVSPAISADDNFTGALMSVEHLSVLADGTSAQANGAPFMVQNNGQAATFVIGCEARCMAIRLRVRAAGLPDYMIRGGDDGTHSLIAAIPGNYARSLSNFEVDIDADCGSRDRCASRWAMVSTGPPQSLASRGLASPPSEAEWNAGVPAAGALTWTARPRADDLRFFYPVNAWRQGRAGSARLQCLVTDSGSLRCRAAEEAPANAGFGEAARRMSSAFRVAASDANGQPTANRRVVVPVQFSQAP